MKQRQDRDGSNRDRSIGSTATITYMGTGYKYKRYTQSIGVSTTNERFLAKIPGQPLMGEGQHRNIYILR